MTDKIEKVTYREADNIGKNMAVKLYDHGLRNQPVAIYMKSGVNVPAAMLSVLYTDNFYVVLDYDSPKERISKILDTLKPAGVICDQQYDWLMKRERKGQITMVEFEKNTQQLDEIDQNKLEEMSQNVTLDSPAYALFTSGSTGNPKGVLVTQGNVISYINWFTKCFSIDEKSQFGAQTPLYFSMSVSDFYGAIFNGGCYHMIPKEYFAFPAQLIEYMNERKINTIYWVPSAMGIIAKWNLFKYARLEFIEKVMFAGEAMPVKFLNYWRHHLPNVEYANLFGPTETTDICAYYKVNREFEDCESLPIGVACDNCQLMIINDDISGNNQAETIGELYVKGPFVAKGYYRNLEKTREAFVQNPMHNDYPDSVYKTGDLVQMNDRGELIYLGRKDFQIKHMGYRIEPGEIETVLDSLDDKIRTVCLYDDKNDQLVLVYEASKDISHELDELAAVRLPVYMRPGKYEKLDCLPINANGKIDRKVLAKMFIEG